MPTFEPLNQFAIEGNLQDIERGNSLLQEGKVACLILSGGQGTRLGFDMPKGMVPLPFAEGKTLLQCFFEQANSYPVALMTSPINHEEIARYVKKNGWKAELFSQNMLPFLDDAGNPLKESGPDGNGGALKGLVQSKILEKWKKMGVAYVTVIPIDNYLAKPFDPALIGHHANSAADITLKVVKRKNGDEKMGMVVKEKGRIRVVEYSEMDPLLMQKVNPDGSLAFALGNTGLYCFSVPFIEKAEGIKLPYHLAHKESHGRWVWKRETFLFDLLPYASQVEILLSSREKNYAPIKDVASLQKLC